MRSQLEIVAGSAVVCIVARWGNSLRCRLLTVDSGVELLSCYELVARRLQLNLGPRGIRLCLATITDRHRQYCLAGLHRWLGCWLRYCSWILLRWPSLLADRRSWLRILWQLF